MTVELRGFLRNKMPNVTLNSSDSGRIFEGIGAVSAATSRLLYDYPAQQRSDILDFMFRPNFGASVHELKVEIGGDGDSGATAPSHAHTQAELTAPSALTFSRGVEWWLMAEAKARNPNIKLGALAWCVPGWVGTFFSQNCIDYLIAWINGAKTFHNLSIDHIGVWNETAYQIAWVKSFHQAIVANNAAMWLNTKLVVGDSIDDWSVAADMASDPSFNAAVDVIGVHYPTFGINGNAPYDSTPAAKTSGKSLWSTEDGPWWIPGGWNGSWPGCEELIRIYLRNYIVGKVTKTLIWPPFSSYYFASIYIPNYAGMMLAISPWSGHYEVQNGIWVTAQVAQFVQPGWQFLDSACIIMANVGSCVALKSTNGTDWSLIVETTNASSSTPFSFSLAGGFRSGACHVWRTNQSSQFARLSDLNPSGGVYTLSLAPHSVYTFTSTTGQFKGSHAIPPQLAFPFPYSDPMTNYPTFPAAVVPKYGAAQGGAFESIGSAIQQKVLQPPVDWPEDLSTDPYWLMGEPTWTDYSVSVDFLLGPANSTYRYAVVMARISEVPGSPMYHPWPVGYQAFIDDTGAYQITRVDYTFGPPETYQVTSLLYAVLPSFDITVWHTLKMSIAGNLLTIFVDGVQLAQATDNTYPAGLAGAGCGTQANSLRNFSIGS